MFPNSEINTRLNKLKCVPVNTVFSNSVKAQFKLRYGLHRLHKLSSAGCRNYFVKSIDITIEKFV